MIWDDLTQYTQGLKYKLILQKPDGTELFSMPESYEKTFIGSLKDVDEFSFSLPYYLDTGEPNPHWDVIKTGYNLYIKLEQPETEEYFYESRFKIMSMKNISTEEGILKKEITCKSLEVELSRKIISAFKGSKVIYRFQHEIDSWSASELYPTKQSFIDSGILNVICNLNPAWSVNESAIDSSYNEVYRYIEVDSQACLDFLQNDIQTAFSCLFTYDCINRQIGCKNITNLGSFRGLFLSDNNYILDHVEEVDDSDIVTKLYLYGHEELSFRSKSITGEDYILDLSYYRNTDYMSQSLLDALDAYDLLLESREGDFETLLTSLNTYTSQLTTKQSELAILNAELKVLKIQRDELVQEDANLSTINAQIDAKEDQIDIKEYEIASVNSNITSVTASIEALQTEILISNNFTLEEISLLDQFIIERRSVDDTIIDASELLEEAKSIISKTNQPRIAFDINIVNLYGIVEDPTLWTKITMGDIGAIRFEKFKTDIELRILGFTFKEDDNDLSLSFANKYNLNDPSMTAKLIESTISTTTSLDISKYKTITKDSSEYSAIESSIYGELDLSARTAKAGNNQGISINEHGIVCTNLAYPNEIVQMLNNGIFLTTDNFATCDWALTAQGINARRVRGILGEFAKIYANQIIMNGDEGMNDISLKMTHSNGDYTELTPVGLERYIANPIYIETPLPPNQETFNGETIVNLQSEGWEFAGSVSVTSDKLLLGVVDDAVYGRARIYKYITKENSSFQFTYHTYLGGELDEDEVYWFILDNAIYSLPTTSVLTTFPSTPITLSEGWHSFEWLIRGDYIQDVEVANLYIDNIMFEQYPIQKDLTDPPTYDIIGKNYNYITYINEGATINTLVWSENDIPDVWIQLPEEFKGKDFSVTVFLKDTGSGDNDYSIVRVYTGIIEKDTTNALIKIRARTTRQYAGIVNVYGTPVFIRSNFYKGCNFVYVVTY